MKAIQTYYCKIYVLCVSLTFNIVRLITLTLPYEDIELMLEFAFVMAP